MPRDVVEKHVEARGEIDVRRACLPGSYDNGHGGIRADGPSIANLESLAPPGRANDLELVTEPTVILDCEMKRAGGNQALRGHDRPLGDVDVKRVVIAGVGAALPEGSPPKAASTNTNAATVPFRRLI
jgi:hypothetical protein